VQKRCEENGGGSVVVEISWRPKSRFLVAGT